ncbi:MAG: tRNA (N6-threonylcarbamoyladenosine(37)-N6)-methyltransferase TrmO, partial [Deltaproteobacteria bacterium]
MTDRPLLPASPSPVPSLTLEPIGVIRTPHGDRASAPRQPYVAASVPGTIELFPGRGYERALDDLQGWEYIWVIFWFHLNKGWRPKVLPPRSKVRRGLFSTRTPHRPNPLGLSVLELVSVDRLTLNVRGVDLIDGTPILDIKPYVPWADALPNAGTGWFTPPEDLSIDPVTQEPLGRAPSITARP